MAIGVDQDLAWVAVEAGIKVWAAVPFKGQDRIWTPRQRRLYEHLLLRTQTVEYVCSPGYAAWKMLRRNVWMLQHADHLLAVWNGGTSGGTAHCVRAAQERGMAITRIDPCAVSVVDI